LQQDKFQYNHSIKEFTDRAKDRARPSLIKHNITELKPQDKLALINSYTESICELGSLALARWLETMARKEREG
jgi:hypothetical protein